MVDTAVAVDAAAVVAAAVTNLTNNTKTTSRIARSGFIFNFFYLQQMPECVDEAVLTMVLQVSRQSC